MDERAINEMNAVLAANIFNLSKAGIPEEPTPLNGAPETRIERALFGNSVALMNPTGNVRDRVCF